MWRAKSNTEKARRFQPCGLRGVPTIHCGITAQDIGVENSNDFIITHNFVGQELGQAWLGNSLAGQVFCYRQRACSGMRLADALV